MPYIKHNGDWNEVLRFLDAMQYRPQVLTRPHVIMDPSTKVLAVYTYNGHHKMCEVGNYLIVDEFTYEDVTGKGFDVNDVQPKGDEWKSDHRKEVENAPGTDPA
jgi:hypothetical protein